LAGIEYFAAEQCLQAAWQQSHGEEGSAVQNHKQSKGLGEAESVLAGKKIGFFLQSPPDTTISIHEYLIYWVIFSWPFF
jgi:hypothetical protein